MRFTESKDKFEIEFTSVDSDSERKWLRAEIERLKAQAQINYMAINPEFPNNKE